MDGSAFDRLSRAVGTAASRRGVLGILGSLPFLGLVGAEAGVVARRRRKGHRHHHPQHEPHHAQAHRRKHQRDHAHSEACIPTGQRCPAKKVRGKKGTKLGCNACCQGSFVADASGKKVCGCLANGATCTTDSAASCCSGFCNGSTCQAAPCSAASPCPPCQTCNAATGQCAPVANGTACGAGVVCSNGGCVCTVTSCVTGCCAGNTCSPCPPPITAFAATPATIDRGATPPEMAVLSWSTSNATTCSIDQGVGSVPCTGTLLVGPVSTTMYTLSAAGAGGEPVTAQATLTVQYCHPITSPGSVCSTGNTAFCRSQPIDAFSSADAQAACEACYGVGNCLNNIMCVLGSGFTSWQGPSSSPNSVFDFRRPFAGQILEGDGGTPCRDTGARWAQ